MGYKNPKLFANYYIFPLTVSKFMFLFVLWVHGI